MATYFSILDWEIPQRSLAGYSPWGCKELDMNDGLTLSAKRVFPKSSLIRRLFLVHIQNAS